jgi:fatty acid desaturase
LAAVLSTVVLVLEVVKDHFSGDFIAQTVFFGGIGNTFAILHNAFDNISMSLDRIWATVDEMLQGRRFLFPKPIRFYFLKIIIISICRIILI